MTTLYRATRTAAAACALLLAGCATNEAPVRPVVEAPVRSASFGLAETQLARLSATASLRYDRFIDSRCPRNALCIWAGKVSYGFTLTSTRGAESFTLDPYGPTYTSRTLPGVRFGLANTVPPDDPTPGHPVGLDVVAE